jgi:uncharacterized DUF497 family protein
MRFEFDEKKSRTNLAKHDVDFHTAMLVFDDPYALTLRDDAYDQEERFITLGEAGPGATLFVVHTSFEDQKNEEVIRLISARAATSREKQAYEQAHKRPAATDRGGRGQKGRRHRPH